jgi:NADPH:quinone reductase-like Zn-dependent oxidoreductase
MRAVTIAGGKIVVAERPDPVAGAGEILVRVRAAGLNNADLLQQAGLYPAPAGIPIDLPGIELAGEVVGCGPGAARFAVGDRVMAVVGGAAQAELAVVHERMVMPVPGPVSWEAAGGFPECQLTAHDALFTQAGLALGERVLVSGAAGGVGTAAVQQAAAAGARVIASVRQAVLRPAVEALAPPGAIVAVDPAEAPARGPYDVVLELVGAPNMEANVAALADGGRISVIGTGAGGRAELNLLALMRARGRIFGSTLRVRTLEQKAEVARRAEVSVLPGFRAGRIRVPITAAFDLADAARAYERFAAGAKFGKIVLTIP